MATSLGEKHSEFKIRWRGVSNSCLLRSYGANTDVVRLWPFLYQRHGKFYVTFRWLDWMHFLLSYENRTWTRLFHMAIIPLRKVWFQLFSLNTAMSKKKGKQLSTFGMVTGQGERKLWIKTSCIQNCPWRRGCINTRLGALIFIKLSLNCWY